MTHPKNICIQDYTYELPEDRIANYPLDQRDASKLLIYKDGAITEDVYRNIAAQIPSGSLLVFNNTKVVEARLLFQKPTGGVIELFCLEPSPQYPDITSAMLQKHTVQWHCLVGGASKWKPGQVLEKKITNSNTEIVLRARYTEKKTGFFSIELSWSDPELSFAEILHLAGAVPLPPYIKRPAEETDKERYQTVYALRDGSVAAPTAGLHFTEKIMAELKAKKIEAGFLTLHVGAGTFKPVKSATMEEHDMHAEWMDVSRDTIITILNNLDRGVIAVGTTSLRTMESLYWMGVRSRESGVGSPKFAVRSSQSEVSSPEMLTIAQWDPYGTEDQHIPAKEALQSLLKWMDKHQLERLVAKTQILIAPGYEFKIINGLITNFHQPQSTLLLLVAALIGDDLPAGQAGWKKVYAYALQHEFRFLSYGDGSLLWKGVGC